MKTCTSCNTTKPESEFYRKSPTLLDAACKSCVKARAKAHYAKTFHPPSSLPKTCPACGLTKTADEYLADPHNADGLKTTCTLCYRASVRSYSRLPSTRERQRQYLSTRLQDPTFRAAYNANANARSKNSNRAKIRCRSRLGYAIKTGKLQRQPCEICGQPAHAHHTDYSKPYVVTWLCTQHHGQFHRRYP